ncbi:MAG: hypothetical protein P8Y65_00465 [Campylobacterales bacterium]
MIEIIGRDIEEKHIEKRFIVVVKEIIPCQSVQQSEEQGSGDRREDDLVRLVHNGS